MTAQTSVTEFQPAMTKEQLEGAEKTSNQGHGVRRRITLMTLTKSRSELSDAIEEAGSEAFSAWIEQITEFQNDLKLLSEMADSAHARLMLAAQVVVERNEPQHV